MFHTPIYFLLFFFVCMITTADAQQERCNFRRWVKACLVTDSASIQYTDSAHHHILVTYRKGDTLLLTGYQKEHGTPTIYYVRLGEYEGRIALHHIGFYYSTGYYTPGYPHRKQRSTQTACDTLPDGTILYKGWRGGRYYLNSKGKRVYLKEQEKK